MKRFPLFGLFCTTILLSGALRAEVKLPKIFGNHAVFQQQRKLPVWGWASPGEKVTVSLGGGQASAVATPAGEWRVDLPPMEVATGLTLKVVGANTIEFTNIAIGEVWIGSGQSNMQWTVSNSINPAEEIAAAKYPNIRLFYVPRVPSGKPEKDINAEWKVCTPETVPGFSAILYFFGRDLHKNLKVPMGLVNTSWGGTRIEPWTPPVGFAKVPALSALHQQVTLASPQSPEHKQKLAAALKASEEWMRQAREAEQKDLFVPNPPALDKALLPLKTHRQPTGLYNGMVHALIPYAIRGAIWYQGESNRNDGEFYYEKKKALIAGWRELWKQGDFPFLFVQLAPYHYGGSATKLAEIQWGQTRCLNIPNTGMAVSNDVGNIKNIHPRDKQTVSHRLALWALANTYGQTGFEYSGPLFESSTVEGDAIRVRFTHGKGLKSRDGKPLTWFEIINKKSEWTKADARIDGDTVLVSSPEVSNPCAVRFAWHQEAEPNLVNAAGLPASVFLGGKPPVHVNLALNKPFKVSDPNTYGPDWRLGLTDGSWSGSARNCLASGNNAKFPKFATVDLEKEELITRIVFGVPDFGSTQTVAVEISSDGKTFTPIETVEFTVGKAEKKTVAANNRKARYVRLHYIKNSKVKKGYDVNFIFTTELEVYGVEE